MTSRNFENKKNKYFKNKIKYFEEEYKSAIKTYELSADIIFRSIVNKPYVINLFEKAHFGANDNKNEIRKKLHDYIQPYYRALTKNNIRQLHFHLPNSESFLRMHRPNKFGDSLRGIRSTVDLANQMHVFVFAFEEGRIFNGFRYVYPLFKGDLHLGSVEISVSFTAIEHQLEELYNNDYFFILKRSVIEEKVFKDEKLNNYMNSGISDKYWKEKINTKKKKLDKRIIEKLNSKTREMFLNKDSGKAFCFNTEVEKKNYIISFLPVYNLEQKHVAYIYCYSERSIYNNIKQEYQFNVFLLSTLNLSILVLIFTLNGRTNSIKKVLEDRKKTEELRENTERMIRHDLKNPLNGILGNAELLLLENKLDSDQKTAINYMLLSARKMLKLIDSSIKILKMEQGVYVPERTDFDIISTFQSLENTFKSLLSYKENTLKYFINNKEININEYDELIIYDDLQLYEQLFSNLIKNAIDASPKEKEISIFLDQSKEYYQFHIVNEGVVPLKIRKNFFEKYATAGKKDGTGLGTYIIKLIVGTLNGRIDFSTNEKDGTKIYFSLPKHKAN